MAVAQVHPASLQENARQAWPAHVAPRNAARAVSASVLACDALLSHLTAIRDTLILPLARAAAALAAHDGWRSYGYVTRTDFARERLQRDVRWLADLIRLHETVERLPALGRALCGTDGGPPLGSVATLQIGRVATPESVGWWIARARHGSLDALRAAVAAHLATQTAAASGAISEVETTTGQTAKSTDSEVDSTDNSTAATELSIEIRATPEADVMLEKPTGDTTTPTPLAIDGSNPLAIDDASGALDVPRVRLFCLLPPDVKLVVEESLELHRHVAGREAGPAEFAQALSGEAASVSWTPPEDFHPRIRPRANIRRTDAAWSLTHASPTPRPDAPSALACGMPGQSLSAVERSTPIPGAPGPSGIAHALEPCTAAYAQPAHVRALYSPAMRRALQRIQEFDQLQARIARLESKLAVPAFGPRRRIRDLRRLVRVLESLRRLEDALEIDIGDLLLELHEHRSWNVLGFPGLEAYAEERLRMGRSTARKRVALARQLRRLAVVRQAYAAGMLGIEAAQFVGSILHQKRAHAALQTLWVEHAHTTTIKRLRSERRQYERERLLALIAIAAAMTPSSRDTQNAPAPTARRSPLPVEGASAEPRDESDSRATGARADRRSTPEASLEPHLKPMDDATWRQSLRLVPGETRSWVLELGCGLLDRVVRNGPLTQVPLWLDLPVDVASELLGCIEAARRALATQDDSALTPAVDSRLRPAARIAREFTRRQHRVPDWVGLLAVLEEWVLTNDAPEAEPRRPTQRIFERDGYRCMAPGCTSRARLQVHHVEHRAWGGGQEPENLLVLCLFHHMQGEHGGLARVRGRAPLDIVWRLGAKGLGVWYRNEKRLGTQDRGA